MKEELLLLIGKLLSPIIALFLPVFAIAGKFHATGNYFTDLFIAIGISSVLWLFVWLTFRRK